MAEKPQNLEHLTRQQLETLKRRAQLLSLAQKKPVTVEEFYARFNASSYR